jgi:hypothetical protein
MVPSASIPAVKQNRSKLTETASQALPTAPIPGGGEAINVVLTFFMALLSFRGISTPSLPAQGEQRRSSYFNIRRGNPFRYDYPSYDGPRFGIEAARAFQIGTDMDY